MIITYMGTPGSGKTYEAMMVIIDNLKRGRTIYTNIEGCDDSTHREAVRLCTKLEVWDFETRFIFLSDDDIKARFPETEIDVSKRREFWLSLFHPNAFIILDEIHNHFSNRDWQTLKNRNFIMWAKEHRHLGFDLIMCTTHIDGVDKQVRSLSEWTYVYRKVNYFGKIVKNKYELGAYVGEDTQGSPYQKWLRSYKPKYFHTYKSYITSDIKELNIQKHVNVLNRPIFYIIPLVLVFTVYMLLKSSLFGGGFLGGMKKKIVPVSKVVTTSVSPIQNNDKIIVKPVVIEYRDLMAKKNETKTNKVVIPDIHEAAENTSKGFINCRLHSRIEDGSDVITLEDCGDQYIKKINGVVAHIGRNRSFNGSLPPASAKNISTDSKLYSQNLTGHSSGRERKLDMLKDKELGFKPEVTLR